MGEKQFYYKTSKILDVEGKYRYAREPVLRRMPDGSLISFALSGGLREPANDNIVLVTRSTDNGKTWSEPSVAFEHSCRAVWATEVFTEIENKPMLFIQTYVAESRYRELQTFVSYTNDCGKTWTEPVSIGGGVNGICVRQGIKLNSGRLVFPVYWQECVKDWDWKDIPEEDTMNNAVWPKKCGVMISDDNGDSFYRKGCLSADYLLWENNIVEIEPDHLVMMIRAERAGCLYRSESWDGGVTWTPARATDIPGAGSKISMTKLGKSVAMVFNANSYKGPTSFSSRTNLEIWISDDGLNSWKRKLPLCKNDNLFFYPHLLKDDNEEQLLVAFENGLQHYLMSIPYEELIGGDTP